MKSSTHFLSVLAMVLTAPALAAPALAGGAAPFWTAICRGSTDANYTQTVGAGGTFNQGLGDGSYETWPVRQTFYKAGEKVCGAVKGSERFAQVCADNLGQRILIKYRDPKHPKAPLRDGVLCQALVRIH